MVSVCPARWCTSTLGVVPAGLGDGVGDCHDVANFPRVRFFISLLYLFFGKYMLFCKGMVCYFCVLLSMLVGEWEPTPCYRDAFSVDTPKWAYWEKGWQNHCKTTVSTLFGRLFEVVVWMLHIGRARHPWSWSSVFYPWSAVFVNVGGWLTSGDLALDSCAQFLAVAEHRLIPSRARSVCHQLRKAGHQSVWSLACQDQVAGGGC